MGLVSKCGGFLVQFLQRGVNFPSYWHWGSCPGYGGCPPRKTGIQVGLMGLDVCGCACWWDVGGHLHVIQAGIPPSYSWWFPPHPWKDGPPDGGALGHFGAARPIVCGEVVRNCSFQWAPQNPCHLPTSTTGGQITDLLGVFWACVFWQHPGGSFGA